MKEKIIKILQEHSLELKVKGEMFRNDHPEKYLWEAQFETITNKIENLIQEDYVDAYDMFEFIAWKDDKVGLVYLYWEDHFNIINLYHYWFKNIKNKKK